jgi:pimeloyl-ACP methyl ester carboxylesterase
MPAGELTIPGYGRTVERLCERLGLATVAVVGNSMGGFVGAELAIQFPERAERLLLVSAAGISSSDVARTPVLALGRIAAALSTNSIADHRRVASRPGLRHGALALVARYPGRIPADAIYEGLMLGAGKPGMTAALRATLDYDFRERLPEIARPTLVVWGEEDMILPSRDAHEFERLIPDARKVMLEDTGHVPMFERPETFNELMLEFLGETGPAEDKEPYEAATEIR